MSGHQVMQIMGRKNHVTHQTLQSGWTAEQTLENLENNRTYFLTPSSTSFLIKIGLNHVMLNGLILSQRI